MEQRSQPIELHGTNHPILGGKLESPLLKNEQRLFQSIISEQFPDYLNEHKVYGKTVVPAAAYVDMILSAAYEIEGSHHFQIKNLGIQSAIILDDGVEYNIQTTLEKSNRDEWRVSIYSRGSQEHGENQWKLHVSAILSIVESVTDSLALSEKDCDEIRDACRNKVDIASFYSEYVALGLDYGERFKSIETLFSSGSSALASIVIAKELSADKANYSIHPAVLDACFQTTRAAMPGYSGSAYLPLGCEVVTYIKPLSTDRLYCYSKSRDDDSQGRVIIVDIAIRDESGDVCIDVQGLQFLQASKTALVKKEKRIENLLYTLDWEEKQLPYDDDELTAYTESSWLVFVHNDERSRLVLHRIEELGIPYVAIYFDKFSSSELTVFEKELETTLAEAKVPFSRIVHLWSTAEETLTQVPDTEDAIDSRYEVSCVSVLSLVRVLTRMQLPTTPQLWLVTKGVQGDEVERGFHEIAQYTLWGMGRTIQLEHPELRCVLFDSPYNEDTFVNALCQEIINWDGESQIAYQHNQRLVARIIQQQLAKSTNAIEAFWSAPSHLSVSDDGNFDELDEHVPFLVRSDSTYLITGGLGSLGKLVAQWLVEKGAKHIALVARSAVSREAQVFINGLKDRGVDIYTFQADVADYRQMQRLFTEAASSMPALAGVVHTAGVLADGMLHTQDWVQFASVFPPKVAGAWNLHLLSQNMTLDFFVCFSSSASLLGASGQANYAAANGFMDGLAHYRYQHGLPCLSINWGPWAGLGMAANVADSTEHRFAKMGVNSLLVEEGMHALEYLLLNTRIPQAAVMSMDWQKYISELPSLFYSANMFERLVDKQTHKSEVTDEDSEIVESLKNAPVDTRRELLQAYFQSQLAEILGYASRDQIDTDDRLFDLGIDSLLAVSFKAKIESTFNISLSATLVFDYPTINTIVDYLMLKISGLHGEMHEGTAVQANETNVVDESELEEELLFRELDEIANELDIAAKAMEKKL